VIVVFANPQGRNKGKKIQGRTQVYILVEFIELY
jgi:hypothetical protein